MNTRSNKRREHSRYEFANSDDEKELPIMSSNKQDKELIDKTKQKESSLTESDSNSKTESNSSLNQTITNDVSIKKEENAENIKEPEQPKGMIQILTEDEKMLLNLKSIGSLDKGEKLLIDKDLLVVDERYLQGMRRYYTEDSRERVVEKVFSLISDVHNRIYSLLEEDHRDKLEGYNKYNNSESLEEKQRREKREERCKKIQNFYEGLSVAKKGLSNMKETYTDKPTRTKLELTTDKLSDILRHAQNNN